MSHGEHNVAQPGGSPPTLPGDVSPLPPPFLGYARPALPVVQPIREYARRAIVLMWVALAVDAVNLVWLFPESVYDESEDFWENPAVVGIYLIFGLGYLAVYIIATVFYMMWQYRAHQNSHAMSPGNLRFSPAWGVGYWFIPVINFYRPYQVTREIDAASPEAVTDASADAGLTNIIRWWWACWLLSLACAIASFVIDALATGMSERLIGAGFGFVAALVWMGNLYLSIVIIRHISDRQARVSG